ncbi:MAG: JmjC domain-containing protein [Burkholderiaceae bacterium]
MSQIEMALSSGLTICSDHRDPGLDAFMDQLRLEMGFTGSGFYAQCYESYDGHGLSGHFDNAHVFVMQVEGQKRWLVSKQPLVPHPADDAVLNAGERLIHGVRVRRPRRSECVDVLLRPGDLLYVPAGAWHLPVAVGYSMALSISPLNVTVAQLVNGLIEQRLRPDWLWRQALPPVYDPKATGVMNTGMASQFRDFLGQLRTIVNNLDEHTLARAWLGSVTVSRTRPKTSRVPRLTPATRVRHVCLNALRLLAEPDRVTLIQDGFEATMARGGLPLARWIATHRAFVLRDALTAQRGLRWKDLEKVIAALIAGGVLEKDNARK